VCVEQEEESKEANDGVLGYTRLFECAPHKGYFTGLLNVKKDSRFTESSQFIHRNPELSQSCCCLSLVVCKVMLVPSLAQLFI